MVLKALFFTPNKIAALSLIQRNEADRLEVTVGAKLLFQLTKHTTIRELVLVQISKLILFDSLWL